MVVWCMCRGLRQHVQDMTQMTDLSMASGGHDKRQGRRRRRQQKKKGQQLDQGGGGRGDVQRRMVTTVWIDSMCHSRRSQHHR